MKKGFTMIELIFVDGNTSNILEYPIFSEANRDGAWVKTNTENTYEFRVMGVAHTFFYDKATGTFNCYFPPKIPANAFTLRFF